MKIITLVLCATLWSGLLAASEEKDVEDLIVQQLVEAINSRDNAAMSALSLGERNTTLLAVTHKEIPAGYTYSLRPITPEVAGTLMARTLASSGNACSHLEPPAFHLRIKWRSEPDYPRDHPCYVIERNGIALLLGKAPDYKFTQSCANQHIAQIVDNQRKLEQPVSVAEPLPKVMEELRRIMQEQGYAAGQRKAQEYYPDYTTRELQSVRELACESIH